MKRKIEDNKYHIKKYSTWFFWKACLFCGQEFRREPGCRFTWINDHPVTWNQCCADCCETKEDVRARIDKLFEKPPKVVVKSEDIPVSLTRLNKPLIKVGVFDE